MYADDSHIKKFLSEKYRSMSISELKENKEMVEDLIENDICMTVRLQIVYGRLSIRSVRNAFEESVGKRLQKFGGADNKELLQRYTHSILHAGAHKEFLLTCLFVHLSLMPNLITGSLPILKRNTKYLVDLL